MDSRAGYLLINIIVVGIGAWFGFVNYLIELVPDAILAPVLFFVGVEIAMQVFLISEKNIYQLRFWAYSHLLRMAEIKLSSNPDLVSMEKLNTLFYTVNSGKLSDVAAIVTFGNGFIVTGTLWAALVYYLIERRIVAAVVTCVILAVASLFGVIHSINLDGSMYWFGSLALKNRLSRWRLPEDMFYLQ